MSAHTMARSALLLLLVAGAAQAEDWTQSFTPAAAGSYLESTGHKVLVAAAGVPEEDARAAATALELALRASGRAQLVMGSAGLGSLAPDSDAQVLQKAKPLPVDRVAVVRVFAGAPGAPTTAVVTLYDVAGKVLSALSVVAGSPLAPREGSALTQAVPTSALESVQRVGDSASDAQAQYDKKYVWFEDRAWVGVNTGQVHSQWTVPYQGKSRRLVEGAAFYEAVGRPDLATTYRKHQATKVALSLGGGAAALAGTVGFTYSYVNQCQRANATGYHCLQRDTSLRVPSAVLAGVGLVAMTVGLVYRVHPVDAPGRRELADDFNKKLKGELGLARAPAAPSPELEVAAGLLPGGAGLRMELRL